MAYFIITVDLIIIIGGPIFIIFFNRYKYRAKQKTIKNLEEIILQDCEIIEHAKKEAANQEIQIDEENKKRKANIDLAYENLFNKITKICGSENAVKFNNHELWIAMPAVLALFIKGAPDSDKENVSANKTTIVWYYGMYKTSHGTTKYERQIVVENDLVTSWQDL